MQTIYSVIIVLVTATLAFFSSPLRTSEAFIVIILLSLGLRESLYLAIPLLGAIFSPE
jgi:hypothetical protein